LKPESWGSPLVQEKYQAEKACDKRHPYCITTTTTTTTTTTMITTTTKSYPVSELISTLCIFLCAVLLLLDSLVVPKTA